MEKVKQKALTFDDVLLLPRYSDFIPNEASTQTKLTKNINIKVPLISAAMDTVTESRMAIALAEVGGIGIIHKNNSIDEQVLEVKTVKKYESGVVRNPLTIESSKSIGELIQLTTELNISGMPVVDNGKLKGIVTSRDFRYADNMDAQVSSIMTPYNQLITVEEGTPQETVKKLMHENRIEKVLVIGQSGALGGLVTMKDIEKSAEHPDATKDDSGSLMVGAALGTGSDTLERAKALSEAGVDVFVIDSAHGHSKNVVDTIKMVKKEFSNKINPTLRRYKGLGEMPADQLKSTTMHPDKRKLLSININQGKKELKETEALFESLMGKKAEYRFKFIQENANFTDQIDI